MARIVKNVIIMAPVDKVFDYISNPRNMLEWHPNITKIRDVTGKDINLHWAWNYKMMGIDFTGKARVISHIICTELRLENTGEIESNWTLGFSPEAGGTRLDFEVDYTIPAPVLDRVNELLALQRNERVTAMALANIKERMES